MCLKLEIRAKYADTLSTKTYEAAVPYQGECMVVFEILWVPTYFTNLESFAVGNCSTNIQSTCYY